MCRGEEGLRAKPRRRRSAGPTEGPRFLRRPAALAFEPLAFLLLSRSAPVSIEKVGGDEHGTRNHGIKIQSILRLSRNSLESFEKRASHSESELVNKFGRHRVSVIFLRTPATRDQRGICRSYSTGGFRYSLPLPSALLPPSLFATPPRFAPAAVFVNDDIAHSPLGDCRPTGGYGECCSCWRWPPLRRRRGQVLPRRRQRRVGECGCAAPGPRQQLPRAVAGRSPPPSCLRVFLPPDCSAHQTPRSTGCGSRSMLSCSRWLLRWAGACLGPASLAVELTAGSVSCFVKKRCATRHAAGLQRARTG